MTFTLLTQIIKEKYDPNITKNVIAISHFKGVAGALTMGNDEGDSFFDFDLVVKEIGAQ